MIRTLTRRLVTSREPVEIAPGILLTGEIPRRHAIEDTGGPFYLDAERRTEDLLPDDQALVLDVPQGLVVLLGCGHSGVVNTLERIREIRPDRPLHALIGGMHLLRASEQRLAFTADGLARLGIAYLAPNHCTGLAAVCRLRQRFLNAPAAGLAMALLALPGTGACAAGEDPAEGTGAGSVVADPSALLQAVIDRAVALHAIEGVAATVVFPDGSRWRGVSGCAVVTDEPSCPPVVAGDRFRVGSITKTFVATLVLQLVEEGALRLTDRLDAWLPDLKVPEASRITVEQLLNMTAGVPNYLGASLHEEDCSTTFLDCFFARPLREWPPETLVALSGELARPFAPGEGWQYSNTNYILLGLIAEKAACRAAAQAKDCPALEELVGSRVFAPLGLDASRFPTTPAFSGEHSRGYAGEQGGEPAPSKQVKDLTFTDPSASWAAGAVISTVDDLARWAALLSENPDQVLYDEAIQKARMTFVPAEIEGLAIGYGLGVLRITFPSVPELVNIGHGGEIFGYSAMSFQATGKGLGPYEIAVTTNRFLGATADKADPALLVTQELERVLVDAARPAERRRALAPRSSPMPPPKAPALFFHN